MPLGPPVGPPGQPPTHVPLDEASLAVPYQVLVLLPGAGTAVPVLDEYDTTTKLPVPGTAQEATDRLLYANGCLGPPKKAGQSAMKGTNNRDCRVSHMIEMRSVT